jgi:hypothetical protein
VIKRGERGEKEGGKEKELEKRGEREEEKRGDKWRTVFYLERPSWDMRWLNSITTRWQ